MMVAGTFFDFDNEGGCVVDFEMDFELLKHGGLGTLKPLNEMTLELKRIGRVVVVFVVGTWNFEMLVRRLTWSEPNALLAFACLRTSMQGYGYLCDYMINTLNYEQMSFGVRAQGAEYRRQQRSKIRNSWGNYYYQRARGDALTYNIHR